MQGLTFYVEHEPGKEEPDLFNARNGGKHYYPLLVNLKKRVRELTWQQKISTKILLGRLKRMLSMLILLN